MVRASWGARGSCRLEGWASVALPNVLGRKDAPIWIPLSRCRMGRLQAAPLLPSAGPMPPDDRGVGNRNHASIISVPMPGLSADSPSLTELDPSPRCRGLRRYLRRRTDNAQRSGRHAGRIGRDKLAPSRTDLSIEPPGMISLITGFSARARCCQLLRYWSEGRRKQDSP